MSNKNRALKAFYENLAQSHKDFASYYLNPTGISRIVKILKLLELHPNQAVCDIGCGDGCIASQAKRTIKKVKALDISNIRAKRAKLRGIDAAGIGWSSRELDLGKEYGENPPNRSCTP